jgi:hypothetical protein
MPDPEEPGCRLWTRMACLAIRFPSPSSDCIYWAVNVRKLTLIFFSKFENVAREDGVPVIIPTG